MVRNVYKKIWDNLIYPIFKILQKNGKSIYKQIKVIAKKVRIVKL